METNIQKPALPAIYGKWIAAAVFIIAAVNIVAMTVVPIVIHENVMDTMNKLFSISNVLSFAGVAGFGLIAYSSSNEYIRISAAVFAIGDLLNAISFHCFSSIPYVVLILNNVIPLIGLAVICCSGLIRKEFSVLLSVAVFLALTVCISLWGLPELLLDASDNYIISVTLDLTRMTFGWICVAASLSYCTAMAILWVKIVNLSGCVENEEEPFGDVLSSVMTSRFVIGFPLLVICSQIVYCLIWFSL